VYEEEEVDGVGERGRKGAIICKVSVAAKKGTGLAVETEPGAGLRSGPRWAQE
jgi:hypothetical protein